VRTLAIIPARAGSKGLPGKNTRDFMGKPLVSWAIEAGKRTCNVVSVTTDDPAILEIADAYGVQGIVRPSELAEDETPMVDVLTHALACQTQLPDAVVVLQPTQPLRKDAYIREALDLLSEDSIDSVVSVVQMPAHHSPDYACRIEGRFLGFLGDATRRQDCRPAYYRDGTVYAIRTALLGRHKIYGRTLPLVVTQEESCTIDTPEDWKRAEQMWRTQHGE
jgi:CMP-N-acetylneuraminic acid synthetase